MARTRNWLALGAAYVVALGSATAATFPSFPGWPLPGASSTSIKLPAAKAAADQTTTSGVSAGAYMALQIAISNSSTIRGAGLIAGGPWHCAEGDAQIAQDRCMKSTSSIDVASLVKATQAAANKNRIDDLSNLQNSKFFLYNSEKDTVVVPPMNDRTREYLGAFVPAANITTETSIPSAHGWVTLKYGNSCSSMGLPWLQACNYDAAEKILTQMYGALKPKVPADSKSLVAFDQAEFDKDGSATLDTTGYAYIPKSCVANGGCKIHVALHGCQQNALYVQDKFAVHSGLNEWAEANDIIVLYPQIKISGGNPYACFDWFGYTGADYDTKKAPQIRAIQAMIARLTST